MPSIKLFAILRYTSIILGVASLFFQIGIFTRVLDEQTTALVITITGLSVFLNWADAGIGKPIYAAVRDKHVSNNPLRYEISCIVGIYFRIAIFIVVLFAIITFLSNELLFHSNSNFLVVALLGINLALISAGNFFRLIFSAVDKYIDFEVIDIVRKLFNLSSCLLLFIDESLVSTVCANFVLQLICYLLILYKLSYYSSIKIIAAVRYSNKKLLLFLAPHWEDTKNYFFFMVNETLIYNFGFLYFPFFYSPKDLVLYGVWIRIFSGICTISRAITDIKLPTITKLYFSNNRETMRGHIVRLYILSVVVSTIPILILFKYSELIFEIWLGEGYDFPQLGVTAIGIWALSNAVIHISGSLLIAFGEYFEKIKVYSTISMLMITTSIIGASQLGLNMVETLAISGVFYFFFSYPYHKNIMRL